MIKTNGQLVKLALRIITIRCKREVMISILVSVTTCD